MSALTFLAVLSFSCLSASHNPETGQISLPPPTGHSPVDTIEFELTDNSRTDALAPDPPTPRSFMVQIFYPTTRQKQTAKQAPYMQPTAAAFHEQYCGFPTHSLSSIQTNAYNSTPISLPDNAAHAILFSPGFQYSRIFLHLSRRRTRITGLHRPRPLPHLRRNRHLVPQRHHHTTVFPNITNPPAQITPVQIRVILAACTGDVNFTLTTLLGRDFLSQIPGLGNHIKRGGIAMYGHSLGGATPADG